MKKTPKQNFILPYLKKGNRRVQNEKSKGYFSLVQRALVSGGGETSLVGVRLVKGSDFVQESQVNW